MTEWQSFTYGVLTGTLVSLAIRAGLEELLWHIVRRKMIKAGKVF